MDLKRITAGSLLVLLLLSLCVYYYHYHGDNLKYPSTAAVESYYPEGSTIFVSGTATKVNKDGFYLLDNSGSIEYRIISGKHVKPGDNVQLIGILGPSYTIKSTRAMVETSGGYAFIILRSALALIVFIFIFFRYWKFNFRTFEFTRRH